MGCRERQRLTKEYFDALMEQRALMEKVEAIKASGEPELISLGETLVRVAIEECYERVVVAARPVDYGMGRMFELWREGMGGQFQVVRSVDEAYTRLGVTAENFSQRLFPQALAA